MLSLKSDHPTMDISTSPDNVFPAAHLKYFVIQHSLNLNQLLSMPICMCFLHPMNLHLLEQSHLLYTHIYLQNQKWVKHQTPLATKFGSIITKLHFVSIQSDLLHIQPVVSYFGIMLFHEMHHDQITIYKYLYIMCASACTLESALFSPSLSQTCKYVINKYMFIYRKFKIYVMEP